MFLGGVHRWRSKETDVVVIRSGVDRSLSPYSPHTSFSEIAMAVARQKLTENRGPAHTVACRLKLPPLFANHVS
jgi:hypothetical protein